MYTLDFERNFFPSPEAEKAERDQYYKTLDEFENLRGKVAASAEYLVRSLQLYEKVMVKFIRHYTYHYLRYAVNTTDLAYKYIYARLDAEFAERTAFLQQELIQIDKSVLGQFIEQKPELEAYRFAVESAQRYRPYTLSLEAESILRKSAAVNDEWEYGLYEILLQRTDFGSVKTQEGDLDVVRQRAAISTHPERVVREAGFKQLYAGYESQRDLYAYALINLAKRRNRLAQIHHFEDASSEVYFNSYLTKAEVTNLLNEVRQQAGVYLGYQRLRAEHARKKLGVENVDMWDVTRLPGELPPRFTIEQATDIIREALSGFGAEYGHELASLLDPANGRMDILLGDNRKAGGFSKGFPGVTTVFFSHGFEGFYNDMRVLMHESTHAIHRQLMNNHSVRAMYAEGPHYLFESFAIFNELLLADSLYQRETNRAKRKYYLEQFLDGKGMALFFIAQDAALEQSIYEEVEHDKIKSADDLDVLTKRNNSRLDIWTNRHTELNMRWITNRLFYEDPLYDINYVYGALLALKYYEMFNQASGTFVNDYVSLMSNGFDAPPGFLLSKFLRIDQYDPGLVTGAVHILENKVRLLEQEYSNE